MRGSSSQWFVYVCRWIVVCRDFCLVLACFHCVRTASCLLFLCREDQNAVVHYRSVQVCTYTDHIFDIYERMPLFEVDMSNLWPLTLSVATEKCRCIRETSCLRSNFTSGVTAPVSLLSERSCSTMERWGGGWVESGVLTFSLIHAVCLGALAAYSRVSPLKIVGCFGVEVGWLQWILYHELWSAVSGFLVPFGHCILQSLT